MGIVLFSGAAATTLVVNARWVYPVQPPGTSPLATKGTGSFLLTMLMQLADSRAPQSCRSLPMC